LVDLAGPNEVLVSWTTRELLTGSQVEFQERGLHEIKGLSEPRPVYAVTAGAFAPVVTSLQDASA
jgi:class 3 adenylate cyclase